MPSKIHEHTYNLQQQMPRVPLLENRFLQRLGINSNQIIGVADTNWKNDFDIRSVDNEISTDNSLNETFYSLIT